MKDAAGVIKMLTGKHRQLKGQDRHIEIEESLLHMMSGRGAAERVRDLLLSIFPSAAHRIDESQCLLRINKLLGEDGFRYLPYTQQAELQFAAQVVTAVQAETTGKLKLTQVSQTFIMLWQQCAHFLVYQYGTTNEAGDEVKVVVSGADAMSRMIADIEGGDEEDGVKASSSSKGKDKAKKGADVAAPMLAKMSKYQFAVQAKDKAALTKLLGKASGAKGGGAAKAKAKAVAGGKAVAKEDKAVASAAAMFSRAS